MNIRSSVNEATEALIEHCKASKSEWAKNYSKEHFERYSKTLEIILKHLPDKSSKILDVGSAPCHLIFCMKHLGYWI